MCWPSGLPNMSRIFCRANNLNRSFFCSAKMPQIGSSAAFAANGRLVFLPAAAQGFSPFQCLMRRDLILLKPVGSVRSHAAIPGPAARVSRKIGIQRKGMEHTVRFFCKAGSCTALERQSDPAHALTASLNAVFSANKMQQCNKMKNRADKVPPVRPTFHGKLKYLF